MNKLLIVCLVALTANTLASSKVTIQYHGQSCFYIESPKNVFIAIDPFGPNIQYALPTHKANIVLISHEHSDHNNFQGVAGYPVILHGLKPDGRGYDKVDFNFKDVHITSIPSYHDDQKGTTRGLNTIFIIDIDKFRIVHLGDLGSDLTPEQINQLQPVKVLLIPVGGFFTIKPDQAVSLVKSIRPEITIPMHYKTEVTSKMPFDSAEKFLKQFDQVFHLGKNYIEINIDKPVKNPGIYVLEYK